MKKQEKNSNSKINNLDEKGGFAMGAITVYLIFTFGFVLGAGITGLIFHKMNDEEKK